MYFLYSNGKDEHKGKDKGQGKDEGTRARARARARAQVWAKQLRQNACMDPFMPLIPIVSVPVLPRFSRPSQSCTLLPHMPPHASC